ncbi:MAG: hypothetical protein Q9227_003828 [Pyrenula ochraceoflavens]
MSGGNINYFKLPDSLRRCDLDKPIPVNRRKKSSKLPPFLGFPNEILYAVFDQLGDSSSKLYLALTCKTMARIAEAKKLILPYFDEISVTLDQGWVRRDKARLCQLSCRFANNTDTIPDELVLRVRKMTGPVSERLPMLERLVKKRSQICGKCKRTVEKNVAYLEEFQEFKDEILGNLANEYLGRYASRRMRSWWTNRYSQTMPRALQKLLKTMGVIERTRFKKMANSLAEKATQTSLWGRRELINNLREVEGLLA